MNRRRALIGAAAAAPAALATPAIAQTAAPELRWRLTSSFPRSLDVLFGTAENICRRVAQLTDNRFQIRAFPAGEIVPSLQVLDAVSAARSNAAKRRSTTTSARTRRSPSSPPSPSAGISASRAPG
jgi:TRAP-type mannitol/chloroaromatic compound transport system substrate-binding protein